MIKGVHAMFYTDQPDALRDFLRDKLALPHTDTGGGWLIFKFEEADMGVHPTEGKPPSGTHDISFYCDDIERTVAELRGRGVTFTSEIRDQGWGLATEFVMPGNIKAQLYQPRYHQG
jgi:catechol 2,3-dioxygenase-like lactoylglutathione lyase family enzyme